MPVFGGGWNTGWFCICHTFGSFSRWWSGTTSTLRNGSTILIGRWCRSMTHTSFAFRRLRWMPFLLRILCSILRLLWRWGSWMTYSTIRRNTSMLWCLCTIFLSSAFPSLFSLIFLPSFISWFSFPLLYLLFFLYFFLTFSMFLTSWFISLLFATHFIHISITVTVSCVPIMWATMTCLWFGPSIMIYYWWRIMGFGTMSTWFLYKLSLGVPPFNFRVTVSIQTT
jgi:hypothetical protein